MPFIAPDSLALHWAKVHTKSPMAIGYLLRTATGIVLTKPGHPAHSPYACTDDESIFLNEEWALTEEIMIVCYAIMHETGHHMFGHCALLNRWREAGRVGKYPFVMGFAQCSLDCQVNDLINRSGWKGAMPSFAITDPEITCMLSEEEAYAKWYEKHLSEVPPPSGGPGSSRGEGDEPSQNLGSPSEGDEPKLPGAGGGDLLKPSPNALNDPRREQAACESIGSLPPQNFATGQGTGAGNQALLLHRIRPANVDWRHAIKRRFVVAAGKDLTSWSRLKRRSWANGIALPTKRGLGAGKGLLVGDTSGSMSEIEIETIGGSVADIFSQTGMGELVYLQIDYRAYEPIVIKSATQLRQILHSKRLYQVHGRGGTNMCLAWKWMEENKYYPDICIVMTDMATPFPDHIKPAKDVLWVATRPGVEAPAHAGRTVYAKVDPH